MNVSTTRYVFAVLCLVGLMAIGTAAYVEVSRMRREQSTLTPRHFRWRMFSAALWVLILGSLAYGTLFEWPTGSADKYHLHRFGTLLLGAMILMLLAMALFVVDVLLTLRERQQQHARYLQTVSDVARADMERIIEQKRDGAHGAQHAENGEGGGK